MGLGARKKEGTTYGNARMFSMLISLLKHVNIKVMYGFMSVCVIPVTLVLSPGAKIAYRYFRQKREYGRWKSLKATYKNHCIFGQTVIDKFAMYAGRKLQITYHGDDILKEMMSRPEPMLMLREGAWPGMPEDRTFLIRVADAGWAFNPDDQGDIVLFYSGQGTEIKL